MLQTLLDKIEDMHGRMEKELHALHSLMGCLLERVPDPARTTSLAELRPPPDETAEEEAQRIAKGILHRERWNCDLGPSPYNRNVWMECVRHECNKALLRSNGFDVYVPEEFNSERGCYLRWHARGDASPDGPQ